MRCPHPEDRQEIRRFRYAHGSYFAVQCLKCCARLGKKLNPMHLEIHPQNVRWAERKRGATGLGGSGNSKRQNLKAYYSSSAWKRKREQVLHRDSFTCQSCGEPGNEVHHLRYPVELGNEPLSDLATSCGECNLVEREQRITRRVLGV